MYYRSLRCLSTSLSINKFATVFAVNALLLVIYFESPSSINNHVMLLLFMHTLMNINAEL